MSLIAFTDEEKTNLVEAKSLSRDDIGQDYYCPNLDCPSIMFLSNLKGKNQPCFKNRKHSKHMKGCNHSSLRYLEERKLEESRFDFNKSMRNFLTPTKSSSYQGMKQSNINNATNKEKSRDRFNLLDIYQICKSKEIDEKYGNFIVRDMLIDERSIDNFLKDKKGFRLIEANYLFPNIDELEIGFLLHRTGYCEQFNFIFYDENSYNTCLDYIKNNIKMNFLLAGDWYFYKAEGDTIILRSICKSMKQIKTIEKSTLKILRNYFL